ncbi:MAG TPA: DUF6683 family protein [Granulicella sp.]
MIRFLWMDVMILMACLPAHAQDFSMMSDWTQQQMLNDNLQRNLANSGIRPPASNRPPAYAIGPGIRTPRGMTGTPMPVGATSTYRSSPQVTTRVRAQFVEFIRQTSGDKAAAAVGAELQRRDYLQLWATHAAQDGLRLGDVADAFTAYWVENWQMANAANEVAPAQVQAVRRQVSSTLLSNPSFTRLNDAQKQEMAEVFIYNQVVQDANYVGAMQRGDKALMQKIGDASVQRFRKEMNLDLRQLALTDNGFLPRR